MSVNQRETSLSKLSGSPKNITSPQNLIPRPTNDANGAIVIQSTMPRPSPQFLTSMSIETYLKNPNHSTLNRPPLPPHLNYRPFQVNQMAPNSQPPQGPFGMSYPVGPGYRLTPHMRPIQHPMHGFPNGPPPGILQQMAQPPHFMYPFHQDPSKVPTPPRSHTTSAPQNSIPGTTATALAIPLNLNPQTSSQSGVYSAIYSGVPVYELLCRDVCVMRRMQDSFLNATQVLKVAGFTKPRRTKILEKEMLAGEHEKIQGGYGKYQGTWVPLEAGRDLAIRYGVDAELKPLIEFDPTQHTIGPKPTQFKESKVETNRVVPKKKILPVLIVQPEEAVPNDDVQSQSSESAISVDDIFYRGSSDGEVSPVNPTWNDRPWWGPSELIRESIVEKLQKDNPIKTGTPFVNPYIFGGIRTNVQLQGVKTSSVKRIELFSRKIRESMTIEQRKKEILMKIFLDEKLDDIVELYKTAYVDKYNYDIVLDKRGSTSLHWAASLARMSLFDSLLKHGANLRATCIDGETALIWTVKCSNNYDMFTFPHILSTLRETLLMNDCEDRNVLHHIARTAKNPSKKDAAEYYIDCLRLWLEENEAKETFSSSNLSAFLNQQDSYGDTPLHVSCRSGNTTIAKLLLKLGANADFENNDDQKPLAAVSQEHARSFRRLFRLAKNNFKTENLQNSESDDSEEAESDAEELSPVSIAFSKVNEILSESVDLTKPQSRLSIALTVSAMRDIINAEQNTLMEQYNFDINFLNEEIDLARSQIDIANRELASETEKQSQLLRLQEQALALESKLLKKIESEQDDDETTQTNRQSNTETPKYINENKDRFKRTNSESPESFSHTKRSKFNLPVQSEFLDNLPDIDGIKTPKSREVSSIDSSPALFTPHSSPMKDLVAVALNEAASLLIEEAKIRNKFEVDDRNGYDNQTEKIRNELNYLNFRIGESDRKNGDLQEQIDTFKTSQELLNSRYQKIISLCYESRGDSEATSL